MADIIPFNGILYNPERVNPSLTTAPPYDIVTPEFKEELYNRDPRNIIRIDFGKDSDDDNDQENRYTRAAAYLSDWLKEGTLLHDPEPAFYCYEIDYAIKGAGRKTRGFLAAVKIEDLGSGRIHPHEMTYSKPKSDRLNILRYCNANTSPIFSLYSSRERITSSILEKLVTSAPLIEAENGEGFKHRLWRISDSADREKIREELSNRDVFIADGHHRYETALEFKKEMEGRGPGKTGEESFNYVLMFLSNMEEEGLSLLPTHRIVEIDSDIHIKEELTKYFDLQKISSPEASEEDAMAKMLKAMGQHDHSFGMFLPNTGSYYTLSFTGSGIDMDIPEVLKTLDVTVLHKFIFEDLLKIGHYEYEMDPATAVNRARTGSFEAVFFLNPTRLHDLKKVALAGHRMPPKSTYFYPKLLTGMVMYLF